MARTNNPAGRLHELLVAARAVSPQKGMKAIWMEVLEADGDATLLRRLGQVYTLPGDIRSQVKAHPEENEELLLRPLVKVEAGLQLPFGAKGQQLRQTVDDAALIGLEWTSERLSQVRGEPAVAEDDLKQLQVLVQELFEEVLRAEIDDELRTFLLRHLQTMEAAIEEVRICGVSAIRDVVEATVGGIGLRMMSRGDESSDEGNRLRTKLARVAARAALLVGLTNGAIQLGGHVYDALPLPESTAEEVIDIESEPMADE